MLVFFIFFAIVFVTAVITIVRAGLAQSKIDKIFENAGLDPNAMNFNGSLDQMQSMAQADAMRMHEQAHADAMRMHEQAHTNAMNMHNTAHFNATTPFVNGMDMNGATIGHFDCMNACNSAMNMGMHGTPFM